MNRQQRRAAARYRRKWRSGEWGVGTEVYTQTVRHAVTGEFYWFETDSPTNTGEGMFLDPTSPDIHGPFKTDAECKENQRLVLLGPQCKVEDAGSWDPAWSKPQ